MLDDAMIERVARAIYEAEGGENWLGECAEEPERAEAYRTLARAAIAATGLVEEYARQARELLSADGENHALLAENARLKASGDALAGALGLIQQSSRGQSVGAGDGGTYTTQQPSTEALRSGSAARAQWENNR